MSAIESNISIRLLQLFIGGTAANLTKPFFAALLATGIGASSSGIALSLAAALAVVAGLYGGGQSDTLSRKTVMLWGESMRILGGSLMFLGFLHADRLYYLAAFGFAFHAIGSSYGRSAGDALLFDSLNELNRKFVMQAHNWIWNLTVLLGYLLGGIFLEGREAPFFFFLFLVSIFDFALIKLFIKDRRQPRKFTRSDWSLKAIPISLLREDRTFRIYLLGSTCQLVVEVGMLSVLAVYCVTMGVTISVAGYGFYGLKAFGILIFFNALVILAGTPLYSPISKFISNRIEISCGLTLMLGGFGGLLIVNDGIWIAGFVMLFSLGEIVFKPSRNLLLYHIAPEKNRGAYVALNGMAYRVATMIGPLLLIAFGIVGPLFTAVLAMLLILISLSLFVSVFHKVSLQ